MGMTITDKRSWAVLDSSGSTVASPQISRHQRREAILSSYRGANSGRTSIDWNFNTKSADATLIPERWNLIYRVRERLRNDPVMRGCLKKVVDAIVGPKGFSTTSRLNHERIGITREKAREVEQGIDHVWKLWQKECDYSGSPARKFTFPALLSLQISTELSSGETLTIPRYVARPWATFSFCIQLVAPDRICNPMSHGGPYRGYATPVDGTDVRDGVKIGKRGDIEGIYVARREPGSFQFHTDEWKTDFLPAWNRRLRRANFWHNYQPYRTEATRGEPAFAACLAGFRSLGDYVSDELTRAHMATMFGLAISREEAFDPETEGLIDADKVGNSRERDEAQMELYPGMINWLQPGEKADVLNPNIPGAQFGEFTDKLATWTASPLGLPREDVLNNYAGMNFSSSKASRVSSQRGTRKLQDDVVESYIEPPRERVIEEAWLRGMLDLPGFEKPEIRKLYFAHVTYASPWQDLEPVKEETASRLRLMNGTTSLTRECAMKGINLDELMREWDEEAIMFESGSSDYVKPPYFKQEMDEEAAQDGDGSNPRTEKEASRMRGLMDLAYAHDSEVESL